MVITERGNNSGCLKILLGDNLLHALFLRQINKQRGDKVEASFYQEQAEIIEKQISDAGHNPRAVLDEITKKF